MEEFKTDQEITADEIVNYFFQNCSALISKRDYDFVVEKLNDLIGEYAIKRED